MADFYNWAARGLLRFLQPLALVWLGLLVLTFALWRKGERRLALLATAILLTLQLVGGTQLSLLLLGRLEQPFAGVKIEDLPHCDAVIMLGGAVEPSPHEVANLHLTAAGDRLIMALEVIRLGKAPVLCVSGGHASLRGHPWIEADLIKRALDDRQLPGVPVISFGGRLDTHDEAVHARELADRHGWQRILLVTSAAHMRRALGCFRREGVEAIPVPCNFLTGMSQTTAPPMFGVPNSLGFVLFGTWFREAIGWLEYRRRGWVAE